MFDEIAIIAVRGIGLGSVYALVAMSFNIVKVSSGVLNFAHASFYMLGAFFGFQLSRWFGFWPALVIAPPLKFVLVE